VFRFFLATATLAIAALFVPAADEPPKPKAKVQQLKGEVNPLPRMAPDFVGDSTLAYMAEISVNLKAGQDVSFGCIVPGKGRHVLLVLLDPAGKELAISKSGVKMMTLQVEDVNANGEYKLLIFTSLMGPFTLTATISAEEELNIKALEDEIASLKQQLADAEARLKKAKAKKP